MEVVLNVLNVVANVLIIPLCVFLVGIILIQRGKGGGLAGAFGGVGGSSAFGTKAGDVFTRVTVGIAIAWIALSMVMVVLTNQRNDSAFPNEPRSPLTKELGGAAGRTRKPSGTSAAKGEGAGAAAPVGSSSATPGPAESPLPTDLPAAIPDSPSTPSPLPKKN